MPTRISLYSGWPRSEAEDIAQSAFVRVWRYSHRSKVTNAKGLLFKTAARLALNELRRRKRHARQFTQASDINDGDESVPILENVATTGLLPDERVMLANAFGSLSENSRTAFLMHRVYGFNYAEIAARTTVSRSSIEKYMIRALASLKETAAS